MRVAWLNLTGGGLSGGFKAYVSGVLPRLAARPEITEILCASPAGIGLESWLPKVQKTRFIACEPFKFLRHRPEPALLAELDKFKPDAIFIPVERWMKYGHLPVVCVVHNMAPLAGVKTGAGFMSGVKMMAQAWETGIAVKNAAAVLTPTEYVKDFLLQKYGVAPEKVRAAHFGFAAPAAAPVMPPAMAGAAGHKFIFTAGSMERYRGLEDIIKALVHIKIGFRDVKLVVAGAARPATEGYLRELKELARANRVEKDIVWLGQLEQAQMSWCYANCAVLAMTSRMESFGFVAAEGLAHGCNCVATDNSCLPEIFGDCALYYSPGDVGGLGDAVEKVLHREKVQRDVVSSHARARAAGFSWDIAAQAAMEALKSVIPH